MSASESEEVWLLTGNRPGEVAQQRALAMALAIPFRELPVARMVPTGRDVVFDFTALRPPWPRLAISFGKTLTAALRVRELGGGSVRLVHLGLPRKLAVGALDLIIPMPTDCYVDAANVLRIRMPFNPAPPLDRNSPGALRLLASNLPRPWLALMVGGPTSRLPLEPCEIVRTAAAVGARTEERGGSLFVSTSPRTPAGAIASLRSALPAHSEFHVFDPFEARANPYAALLNLADELFVTGDSASMIAECWRTGKPLWVAPLGMPPLRRFMRTVRGVVPRPMIASGYIAGDVNIGRWIDQLSSAGHIGILGLSDPTLAYTSRRDDDLSRAVARIHEMLRSRDGCP